jgi:hypothetical protein
MAALEAIPEVGGDAVGTPRRNSQLLPNESAQGVVEAINGNIKTLLRRGRGDKNLRYLLLKAQRMAATRIEFLVIKKAA